MNTSDNRPSSAPRPSVDPESRQWREPKTVPPRQGRSSWLPLGIGLLAGVVVAGAGYFLALYGGVLPWKGIGLPSNVSAQEAPSDPAPPAKADRVANQPEAEAAGANLPFADHARQAGITTCAAAYQALGHDLTFGTKFAVRSAWAENEPDSHAIQGVVGLRYPLEDQKEMAAIGYLVAAPVSGHCEGSFVRVVPLPQACDKVIAGFPAGSAEIDNLVGTRVFVLGDNGGQVSILPLGPDACLAVTAISLVR